MFETSQSQPASGPAGQPAGDVFSCLAV